MQESPQLSVPGLPPQGPEHVPVGVQQAPEGEAHSWPKEQQVLLHMVLVQQEVPRQVPEAQYVPAVKGQEPYGGFEQVPVVFPHGLGDDGEDCMGRKKVATQTPPLQVLGDAQSPLQEASVLLQVSLPQVPPRTTLEGHVPGVQLPTQTPPPGSIRRRAIAITRSISITASIFTTSTAKRNISRTCTCRAGSKNNGRAVVDHAPDERHR